MDIIIAEPGQMTPVDTVTYPDETGDFVLHSRTSTESGKWRIVHHNVEDGLEHAFEFDSVPAFLDFLDGCGVSRTIYGRTD